MAYFVWVIVLKINWIVLRMKLSSLLFATAYGAVFDETEADYTVIVPAGKEHCYFQPMPKGNTFHVIYLI